MIEAEIEKEFKVIMVREGRDKSEKIEELVARYVKEHGDGNPNFTLDQFDQQEMKAVPAMFRTNEDWMSYMNGLNEKEFRELETKIYQLKSISDKRWERGFD